MQDLFAEQPVWEFEEIKKKLKRAGHSEATIRCTADDNVVKSKVTGPDGRIDHWTWSLPLGGLDWAPSGQVT